MLAVLSDAIAVLVGSGRDLGQQEKEFTWGTLIADVATLQRPSLLVAPGPVVCNLTLLYRISGPVRENLQCIRPKLVNLRKLAGLCQ